VLPGAARSSRELQNQVVFFKLVFVSPGLFYPVGHRVEQAVAGCSTACSTSLGRFTAPPLPPPPPRDLGAYPLKSLGGGFYHLFCSTACSTLWLFYRQFYLASNLIRL
jgi:hypothetical protein